MSQETQTPQPSWKEIVRAVFSKTKDDYRSTVQPRVKSGRTKLGSCIEVLGRMVKGSAQ